MLLLFQWIQHGRSSTLSIILAILIFTINSWIWIILWYQTRLRYNSIGLNLVDRVEFFQIWTSSSFRIKELEVDWIHRFIYILYDDLSSALNGIEILHATTSDYTSLKSVHHLSFSNLKTISSIKVHPFRGFARNKTRNDGSFINENGFVLGISTLVLTTMPSIRSSIEVIWMDRI